MATEMGPEKIFTSSFWCLFKATKTGGEYFLWAQLGGHVAKHLQASGFSSCWKPWWDAVAAAIRRAGVTFLAGDFNMALFDTADTLREYGIEAVFLGGYAWRELDTRGRGVPGLAGVSFDSLGLFALEPVSTFQRLLTVDMFTGASQDMLDTYANPHAAQGYTSNTYVGEHNERKVLAAYADPEANTHDCGDRLPHIRQKRLNPDVWDALGALMGHGAHMPLIFFVGNRGRRTEQALDRREQNMIRRDWGPGSANRYRMMERQGKNKGKGKGTQEGKAGGKTSAAAESAPPAPKSAPAAPSASWGA